MINEKGEGKIAKWTHNCSLGHLSNTAECVLSKQASYPESENLVNRVESFSLLQLIRKFLGTLNKEIWELIDPFLLAKLLEEYAEKKKKSSRFQQFITPKERVNGCELIHFTERKSIKQEWISYELGSQKSASPQMPKEMRNMIFDVDVGCRLKHDTKAINVSVIIQHDDGWKFYEYLIKSLEPQTATDWRAQFEIRILGSRRIMPTQPRITQQLAQANDGWAEKSCFLGIMKNSSNFSFSFPGAYFISRNYDYKVSYKHLSAISYNFFRAQEVYSILYWILWRLRISHLRVMELSRALLVPSSRQRKWAFLAVCVRGWKYVI